MLQDVLSYLNERKYTGYGTQAGTRHALQRGFSLSLVECLALIPTVNGIAHRSIRSSAIVAIVGIASSHSRYLVFTLLQHCSYCPELFYHLKWTHNRQFDFQHGRYCSRSSLVPTEIDTRY